MTKQRNIMGACEFSIASLQNLKKGLMYCDDKEKEILWSIAGLISSLTCNLIQTCDDVIKESMQSGEADAKKDLLDIKSRFNGFIDRMIEQ